MTNENDMIELYYHENGDTFYPHGVGDDNVRVVPKAIYEAYDMNRKTMYALEDYIARQFKEPVESLVYCDVCGCDYYVDEPCEFH